MEKFMRKSSVVAILALVCCALWGSAFPCVKIGYDLFCIEEVGSQILFAGYRFFLAGIFTWVLGCIFEKRILTMKKSSIPYVCGQGLLQTTLQYFFFYIGLANTTGAKGSVINAANAFVSILVAPLLIKSEKMTWRKAIGCMLGFAGVIIINIAPGAWGSGFKLTGEGFVFICAVMYGTSSVTLKLISHRESPMTLTAYQLLFGGGVLALIGFFAGGHVSGFTLKSTMLLIYMALLTTVSFCIWTTLLKYNPVGKVTIFAFSIPIFGVALSAILLGEQIASLKTVAALICVSIGILIVNTEKAAVANPK